jgi:hypothetical protein
MAEVVGVQEARGGMQPRTQLVLEALAAMELFMTSRESPSTMQLGAGVVASNVLGVLLDWAGQVLVVSSTGMQSPRSLPTQVALAVEMEVGATVTARQVPGGQVL